MEFRAERRAGALLTLLLAAVAPLGAQGMEFSARWKRTMRDAEGTFTVSSQSLGFRSKDGKHDLRWQWQDVQQAFLSPFRLIVLSYHDTTAFLGRDRQFEFDRLPPEFPDRVYPEFHANLGAKLVAAVPGIDFPVVWKVPVKLLHHMGGPEGVLVVGEELIAFRSPEKEASRFWWIKELDNISRSGPADLTIVTDERSKFIHFSPQEFRFQLKEPLTEERYSALWHQLNRTKGLQRFPQP